MGLFYNFAKPAVVVSRTKKTDVNPLNHLFLIEEFKMKCPHCNSLMNIYQKTTTDKSEVSFYRCTICISEHVSSSILTRAQQDAFPNQRYTLHTNAFSLNVAGI
jgi:transposase-like protein